MRGNFKIGDIVKWSGPNQIVGQIYDQCKVFDDSWKLLTTEGQKYNSCSYVNLRMATQEEVMKFIKDMKNLGVDIKTSNLSYRKTVLKFF